MIVFTRYVRSSALLCRNYRNERAFHSSRTSCILFRDAEYVKEKKQVLTLENGAIESRRYLLRSDGFGFSVQHAILRPQQSATLRYQNHVVAVMVTQGEGEMRVIPPNNKKTASTQEHPSFKLSPGAFFALNAAETVQVEAMTTELHLVSVLNPPLVGPEKRNENGVFTMIDEDGIERESYDHNIVRRLFEPPESLRCGTIMKDDPLF